MGWLSETQLRDMGFASLGEDVLISDKASLYNCANISLGSHVRIDDFCVLSAGDGGIEIGSYIHIAVFCSLIGNGKITLCDFSCPSSRVSVYSSNDDYSGNAMTNPMVPEEYTNVQCADVFIGKYAIIGSGSVVLPGVTIHEGVAVGALSLVNKDCDAFSIYVGTPAKKIGVREKKMLELEKALKQES